MTSRPLVVRKSPDRFDKASRIRFLREIRKIVHAPGRPRVIVDLSPVCQMDPDAIDALVECVDEVERADGELTIIGASPEAQVILELTQLASVLRIFPSAAEAADAAGFLVHDADATGHDSSRFSAA